MSALNRKLLRELWQLRGQMASIALVVATGVMTLVTMRGGYETLVEAQAAYYRLARFPDLWVSLERAPEAVRAKLETIPDVARVETRISLAARLDLPEMEAPGLALIVSLPERGRPGLSDIVLRSGRLPAPGARDEVVVSENFATARGLVPGDSVRAIVNGRAWRLHVAGTAISPEHTYAVPPGALFPEDDRYGIFWMRQDAVGPAYDMDGAFNEALLKLAPEADTAAVMAEVDRLLEPYGGRGAYPRSDQFSHQTIQGELDQNRVMGTAIPVVFVGVAAFLLNLVLGRLVATQRTEVGVLKAFGYTDREVGRHYLRFAMVAVAVGTLAGAVLGARLGRAYVDLYGEYFHFPDLRYALSPALLLIASSVSAIAAAAGALTAVRQASRLPPAEAMRPERPARFEAGILERRGVGRSLPPAGRMILRNIERRPFRALISSIGVAFSVAILVIGMFMFDGVGFMMNLQFEVIQREDLALTFQEPVRASVSHQLERLDGVTRVELFRTAPARLRAGHREREVGLQGVPADARLRRVIASSGAVHPVPAQGVVLSERLANKLRVRPGDELEVEVLDGRRSSGSLRVAGVVDDFLGLSATMSLDALHDLAGGAPVVSGAWLSVREDRRADLYRSVKSMPAVAGVASPARMLESFRTQMAESLFVGVGFLLGFASIISVAVLYNGARIALSERSRELASLRVMGFRRGEVATLLLGEQALVTLLAIPCGWVLGYLMSFAVVTSLQTDAYRIPLVVSVRTYALAAVITLVAAAASGWIVRRRVDQLDLIAVLKTRE